MTPVVFLGFRHGPSINTLHQRYTMHFAHNVHQEKLKEENGHMLISIPWFSIRCNTVQILHRSQPESLAQELTPYKSCQFHLCQSN